MTYIKKNLIVAYIRVVSKTWKLVEFTSTQISVKHTEFRDERLNRTFCLDEAYILAQQLHDD